MHRYERLGIGGVRLAGLLLDHAALRERLGLKADADRLGRLALAATREHVASMGLAEMQVGVMRMADDERCDA